MNISLTIDGQQAIQRRLTLIAGLTGVIYLIVAWLLGITPVLFAAALIRQRLTKAFIRTRPMPP